MSLPEMSASEQRAFEAGRERFNERLKYFATPEQKRDIKRYRNALQKGRTARREGLSGTYARGWDKEYYQQSDLFDRLNRRLDHMGVSG